MKIVANEEIASLVKDLKNLRTLMKQMKKQEEMIIGKISVFMQDNDELITNDGEELCSYKQTSDVAYFDAKRFKSNNEALYNLYVEMRPGHKRMVLL